MLVLITYDVSTVDVAGRRRLRRVARLCVDYGQRVQNSVFECELTPAQFVELKAALQKEIDPVADSLRLYRLGAQGRSKVEHIGAKPVLDLEGPLIF